MFEGTDSMESPPTYLKGDIVWVKLSGYWWPGEVINEEDLPSDLLSDFKKPPLVIVKFFEEDSYEYIKQWSAIYPYNCEKKNEFIKKGMAGYRAKLSHMAKFPRDIGTAEEKTNGNPNILSQPEFLPNKKINYDEIFGTPSPKKSTKGKNPSSVSKKSATKDSNEPLITHRRFLGNDDYRAYIWIQYPGKDCEADEEIEEIQKLNEEPSEFLTCQACVFKTKRLGVMLMHTKMHLNGVNITSKRKNKKAKGVDLSDSETEASTVKSPKPKQRKKKVETKSKPRDVFTDLLEEWDDTDEETDGLGNKSVKAKNQDTENEKDDMDTSEVQAEKSATNHLSDSSKAADTPKASKNTQDDIKNCFDFDEEEEEDDFMLPASSGRKIPRVIPEKPRASISELLEMSQKDDDLYSEKVIETSDEPSVKPTESESDVSSKEILRSSENLNLTPSADEAIESTFRELMEETAVPALDDLSQVLKPEQNFHDARTVKFPDKGGTSFKSGTSRKRFVTSFEDFEAGFRKIEGEESSRLSAEREGKHKKAAAKIVNKELPEQIPEAPKKKIEKEVAVLEPHQEIIVIGDSVPTHERKTRLSDGKKPNLSIVEDMKDVDHVEIEPEKKVRRRTKQLVIDEDSAEIIEFAQDDHPDNSAVKAEKVVNQLDKEAGETLAVFDAELEAIKKDLEVSPKIAHSAEESKETRMSLEQLTRELEGSCDSVDISVDVESAKTIDPQQSHYQKTRRKTKSTGSIDVGLGDTFTKRKKDRLRKLSKEDAKSQEIGKLPVENTEEQCDVNISTATLRRSRSRSLRKELPHVGHSEASDVSADIDDCICETEPEKEPEVTMSKRKSARNKHYKSHLVAVDDTHVSLTETHSPVIATNDLKDPVIEDGKKSEEVVCEISSLEAHKSAKTEAMCETATASDEITYKHTKTRSKRITKNEEQVVQEGSLVPESEKPNDGAVSCNQLSVELPEDEQHSAKQLDEIDSTLSLSVAKEEKVEEPPKDEVHIGKIRKSMGRRDSGAEISLVDVPAEPIVDFKEATAEMVNEPVICEDSTVLNAFANLSETLDTKARKITTQRCSAGDVGPADVPTETIVEDVKEISAEITQKSSKSSRSRARKQAKKDKPSISQEELTSQNMEAKEAQEIVTEKSSVDNSEALLEPVNVEGFSDKTELSSCNATVSENVIEKGLVESEVLEEPLEQAVSRVSRRRSRKSTKHEEPPDVAFVVEEPVTTIENKDIEITEKPTAVPEELEAELPNEAKTATFSEITVESEPSIVETPGESPLKVISKSSHGKSRRRSNKIEELLDIAPIVVESDSETTPHSQAALELDDLVEATENKVIEIMEQPTAVPQELEAEAKMATSSSEITVKSVPSVVETPGESTPTPEITFKTGHEKSQRSNKVEEPLDVTPHFHAPLELEERVEGTENKDIEIMEKPTAVPEKFETGISIEEAEAKTATSSEITVENVLSLAETPGQSAPKVRRGRPRKSIKIEKQLDVTAVVGEPCNVTEEKSIEIFEEPPKVPEKLEVEICTAEIPIESAQSATETSEQSTLKVRRGRPRKASKTEEPLDVTPVVGEPGKPTEEMDIEITEKPSEVPEKLEVDISAAEIPVESAQSASETSDESTPKVRRGRSRKSSKIEESLDVTPVVGEPAKATEEKDIEIEKRSEVREILKADISAAELVVESVQPDTETFEESTVKVKRGRPRKSTKTAEHFDDKDAVLKQETIEQSDKLDLEVSPDEIVETIETSESLVELTTTDAAVEHSEEPVSKFRRGRSRKSIKIDEATFVAEVDRATEIEPQIPKDSSKETEKLEPALSVEEIVAERAGASQITEESLSEAVVEKPLSKVRRGRSRKSISIEEPQDAVPVEREVASEIEETTIELENTDVPAVEEVCIEKAETSEVVLETVDLDLKRPEAVGEHVEEPMPKPRRGRPRKSSRIEESLDIAPVVEPNKASEINNSALGLKNAEEISEKLDQIEPAIHAEELDAKTVESSESTTSEAVIESAEEPALKVRRGRSRKSTKIGDFSDSIPTLEESHAMESKSDASSLPEAKSLDRPEPAVSVVEVDVEAPETSVENAQNLDSEIAISEVGAESSEFAPKIRRGRPRKSIKIEESLNVTAAAEERVSAPEDKVNNLELVDAKESAKMIDSQPETAIVAEGADAKMSETSKITEETAQLAPTELEAVVEHHAKFIPKPRRGKSRKSSKILEPLDQKAEVNEPEALVETATVDIEEFSKELDAGGTKDSVNYAESTHLESAKVEVEIEPSKEATSKTRRGKHRKNTKIEEPLEVAPVVEEYVPKTSHEKKLEIPRTLEESIAQSKEALESNTEAVEESSSKTRHRKSRRSNKIGEPSEVAPVVEESDSKTSHEAMEESIAQSTEVLESNMEAVESSCKTRRGKSRSSYKIEELSDVAAVVEESVTKTSHEQELETPRAMEESIAQSMEMLGPNIEAVAESSSRSRHGKSRKSNKIEKPLLEDSVSKTNHETMEESIAQSTEELEPNIEAVKECSTKTRHGKSRRSNKIEEPLGVVPVVEESISKTSHEAMEESIAQSIEVLEPNMEAVESSCKTRHGKSRKTNKIEEPLDAAPVVEESVPKASHESDHEIPRTVEESIAQSTGVLEQNIEAVEESRSRTRHGKSLRRNKIEEPLDRPPIVEESVFKTNYEINVHEIPLPMEEPIAQSTGALEPNITVVEEPSAKTRHGKSRRSNKIEESSDIAPVVVESDSKTSPNEASLNLAEPSAPVGECKSQEVDSVIALSEELKIKEGKSRRSSRLSDIPVVEEIGSETSLTEERAMSLAVESSVGHFSKVRRGNSRKSTKFGESFDVTPVLEQSDSKTSLTEASQTLLTTEQESLKPETIPLPPEQPSSKVRRGKSRKGTRIEEPLDIASVVEKSDFKLNCMEESQASVIQESNSKELKDSTAEAAFSGVPVEENKQSDVKIAEAVSGESISSKTSENYQTEAVKTDVTAEISSQKSTSRRKRGKSRWDTVEPNTNTSPIIETPESKSAETAEVAEIPETPIEGSESEPALQPLAEHSPKRKERLQWQTEEETALNLKEPVAVHESWKDDYKTEVSEIVSELGPPIEAEIISEPAVAGELEISSVEAQVPANEFVKSHVEVPLEPPKDQHSEAPSELELESENIQLTESKELPSKLTSKESETPTSKGRKGKARKHSKLDKDVDVELTEKTVQSSESTDDKVAAVENKTGLGGGAKNIERSTDRTPEKDIFTELPFELIGMLEKRKSSRRHDRYGEEKSSLNESDAKVPSKSLFDESSRSGRDRKRKVSGEILSKEVKEDKRKSKYHKKGKPDVVEPAPLDSSYQSEELNQRLTETIDTHCEVRYSRSRDSRKDKRESRRSRSPKQLVPDDVHEDYSRDSRKERERRRRSRSPKKLLVNLDRLREDRLGRSRDNRKEREERRRSRSPKQMFEDSFAEKDYRSRSRDSKKEREEKYRSRSHRKSKTSSKAQEPSHSDVAGLEDLSKQSTESEQSLQSLGEGVQDIPTYAALKEDGFGVSSPRKSTFTGIVSDTVYGSKSKIRPAQVRSKLSRWDVVSRPDGDQAFEKDAALVIPDDLPKIDDKPFEKPDVLVEKAGFGEDESSSVLVMTNHDRNKVHLETEASDKDSCVNFEHQIEDLPKVQTGVFEPSKEAEDDASKEELEGAVEPVRKDVIETDSQELKSEDSVIIESHSEVESVKEVVEMQEKYVGTLELQSELIETKSTPLGTDRVLSVETAKIEVPFISAHSEITSFSPHKDLETTFLEEETVEVKSHSMRKRKRSRRSKSITDHISPERDVPLAVEDNVEAPTSEIVDGAEAKVLDYTTDVTLALANVPIEEESGAAIFGDSKIDSRLDSAMEQENIDSTPVVTNTDAAVATAITEDEVKDISVAETLHAAILQSTSSESLKMEVSSAEHTSDLNIPIKEALDSVVESVTEAKEEEEPSTTVDKVEDLSIKEATTVNDEDVQIAHENVEIEAEQENCEVVSIKDDALIEEASEAANVGDIEVENKLNFAVSYGLSKIDDGVVDVSNANVEASVIHETAKTADETEIPSVTEEVILHPVVLEEAVVDVTTDSVATAVETDIQGKEEPLGTVKSDSSTGPDGIHDQIVAEDLSLTKVEPEPLILEDNDTVTVNDVSVPHNDMVIVPYSGAEDLSTKDRIPKSSGEVPGSVDDIIPPSVAAASDPSPSDPLELFAAEPAQTVVEHFDDRPLSPKDPIEIPSEVAKAIDVLETDLSKDSEPVEPQKDEDLRGSIRKDKKGRQRKYSEDKLSVDETPEKMVELENSADILENEDKVEKIVEDSTDLIENREISYCSEPTATEKSTEPQIVTESCEVLDEEMLGSVPNQELIDFSGQQNEPQDLSPSVGDDKEKLLDVSSQVEQANEKEPSEKGQQNKVQDLSHSVIDDKEKLLDVPSQIDQADRKEPSESENISEIEGTIFAMSNSKKVKKSKRFSQNVELAAPTVDSCYKESSDEASKGHQSGQQNEPEDLSPSVIDDKGKLLDASSQVEYANRKERSEEENITQLEGTIFSISTSKKVKKNKRFSQDVELAAPTESCQSSDETSKGTTSIEQDFSVEQATLPEGVQQGELEHVPEEARSKKSRHHKHSKPEITPEGPVDYSIRHLSEDLSKESDGADEESSTETGGDEKSRKPSQEYSKASAEIVDQKSSETHPVAIETTVADDSLPEMSKNKPSVDKLKSMPPKKSRWSRRGSYTKKDSDNEQETASAPAHVEEKPVELESVVIEKTDQPTIEANTHENSASSFNDSEIILPPKKSKRVNEVSSQFFTDDFQSPEKKSDADSLCFPSYDDSFMSTTLRNNIEGLIKEIDSIDSNVIPDHSELQRVESDFKPFEMSEAKSEALISEHLLANSPLSEDSRGGLKEGIEIPKGVPPKKKKIELPKDEYFGLPPNNLPQHDMSKSEEKVLDTMPQPPKKKMQKLFENSQAIEKVDKTPDFLLMSPLAKKKSFLFHHEEFDQTQKVEGILQPQKETASGLSKEAGKLSDPPQESIYNTDVDEFLDLPKIRKKRKSSSLRDYPPKKEKLEEKEIFTDDHDQKSKDTFSYGSLQKAAETPLSDITGFSTPVGEDSKPCTSNNEMEVKIEESDFKFNIQTNLSILSTSKAEELSALASKTLSEIKKDVIAECPRAFKKTEKQLLVPPTVKSTEDIKDVKPEVALPQLDPPVPVSALNEPELVPISVTPTVMSEKDLADAQVEITTDKVISEKKPTFPMDFVVVKTEPGTTKPTETVGTEFTSKAMVKEFDNRPLISKPNAYALKSELLDILEGNSNSSTNSSGSEQKFKTSFDNYDKNSTVQGIIDFEEAIPSQIVLSNKVSAESVLMDSPKLLERLSMSSDSGKAKAPTMLIQGDIKVSESLSKAFISKLTKATSGIPKPGQKIVIKTQKAMSKGTKPIILSEQIIRPANAGPSTVKPSGQAQGLKRQYEDVEDVETAFIIPKIAKKTEEVEEPAPPTPVEKPSRARGSKISGKAKILQQTIITPKGEVIPQAPPTTAGKTIQLQQVQIQPGPDDAVFDINSMPIVLSDDILTPESIQNMPVVLSEEVLPQSTTAPAAKGQEKLLSTMSKKIVSGIGTKQIIFKTTQPGSGAPVPLKHAGKARILSTSSAAPSSRIAKPTATALLATGTTADGKPAKYVLVPPSVTPATTQVKSVKQAVPKKQVVVPSKLPTPAAATAATTDQSGQIVGNKIMIVTNAQGQQTRVVLTPQQQKAFMQAQPGSKTKAIIKGAIPKALLESAAAVAAAGPSGIAKTVATVAAPGPALPVSSHGGLVMPTVKSVKAPVPPKKGVQKPTSKPQKTILIKNQLGQTVRKIQGTDDDDLDRQVAEQLEAIKASARLQQANKTPEIINYTNRQIPSANSRSAIRKSYSKKVDPLKVKIPVPVPQTEAQKPAETSVPALAPLSPQPRIPQIQNQTPQIVTTKHAPPRKVEPPASSSLNKALEKCDIKPPVAPAKEVETKRPESPLRQVVIQDGLGNLTTVTVGQILAIPSETVDGQPQSYMLVTVDESGNLTPLNNDALMSLDPSLGAAGDVNNMMLQVDQGQQGTVAAIKPAESTVAHALVEEKKKVEERVKPEPTKPALPVKEPKAASVLQARPHEVPLAVEQQIVIGEGVLPGDSGGQQLIVTGDPIATQKFLESLSDGSTDLANILANAEGGSVLIQADGQQILIRANPGAQPMMGMTESTEGGGNPIFATHKPNQDILAAALANTDVFQPTDQLGSQTSPIKGLQPSQLSPGGAGLYPMHVGNVLETSLTLSSPIMTPLEVPSTNSKKIDDDVDILNQVPKNVDLPITITDPNISQTVAHQQAAGLMELTLPITETPSADINSPSYSYSLPALEDSVGISQKSFSSSMPLLTEDVVEVESSNSSNLDRIRACKELKVAPSSFSPNFGSLPMLPDTIESSREEAVKTSTLGDIGSLSMLTDDVIEDSGSSMGSTKPPRSSPKTVERDIVDEGLSTLGGEMCSSLSEPPPDMFDLSSLTHKEEEVSSDVSSIPEPETLSLNSENSGEIPIQPPIVATLSDLKRSGEDSDGSDEKRPRFD